MSSLRRGSKCLLWTLSLVGMVESVGLLDFDFVNEIWERRALKAYGHDECHFEISVLRWC